MRLGEKIRQQRERRDLTQEELAQRLHVSRQAITKWEADGGMPDVENLSLLADELGVSVDWLMGRDDADAQGYRRRGLFSAVADRVSAEATARPCSWAGFAGRVLAVVALFAACAIAHGIYVEQLRSSTMGAEWAVYDYSGPGVLGLLGITWETWWGTAAIAVVMAVGVLSPFAILALALSGLRGRLSTAAMPACVACGCMTYSIPAGNDLGASFWLAWGERTFVLFPDGLADVSPWRYGALLHLPVFLTCLVPLALSVVLWFLVRRQASRGNRLSPRAARLVAGAPALLIVVATVLLRASWQTQLLALAAAALLATFLACVLSNELAAVASSVAKRRPARVLWAAASLILWEAFIVLGLCQALVF